MSCCGWLKVQGSGELEPSDCEANEDSLRLTVGVGHKVQGSGVPKSLKDLARRAAPGPALFRLGRSNLNPQTQ